MSFEQIDNIFQITLLSLAAFLSAASAMRYRSRKLLMLALGYACFAMGTLYFILSISITGDILQDSYASEILWAAAYFFFLSVQLVRIEHRPAPFSTAAAFCAFVIAAIALRLRVIGPAILTAALFAITSGILFYLALSRILAKASFPLTDACFMTCILLELLLYFVSGQTKDYTHFNLYFAVDLLISGSMFALLPLSLREVKQK